MFSNSTTPEGQNKMWALHEMERDVRLPMDLPATLYLTPDVSSCYFELTFRVRSCYLKLSSRWKSLIHQSQVQIRILLF